MLFNINWAIFQQYSWLERRESLNSNGHVKPINTTTKTQKNRPCTTNGVGNLDPGLGQVQNVLNNQACM